MIAIKSVPILTSINLYVFVVGLGQLFFIAYALFNVSSGQGGFGEIYLASDDPNREVRDTDKFVVKVEPHNNGPLFTEMHCYLRIAKPDQIDDWMKELKLKRFGMPKYLGSGSFDYNNQKYRFMVMERFGSDLQKILEQHNKKFSFKTVYQIGLEIVSHLFNQPTNYVSQSWLGDVLFYSAPAILSL